jgi:hypothetical protein
MWIWRLHQHGGNTWVCRPEYRSSYRERTPSLLRACASDADARQAPDRQLYAHARVDFGTGCRQVPASERAVQDTHPQHGTKTDPGGKVGTCVFKAANASSVHGANRGTNKASYLCGANEEIGERMCVGGSGENQSTVLSLTLRPWLLSEHACTDRA